MSVQPAEEKKTQESVGGAATKTCHHLRAYQCDKNRYYCPSCKCFAEVVESFHKKSGDLRKWERIWQEKPV